MDSDKIDEAESCIHKAQSCNANEDLVHEWLKEIQEHRTQKEILVGLYLHNLMHYVLRTFFISLMPVIKQCHMLINLVRLVPQIFPVLLL